ncbi:hypothetical protein [Bacillus taeanensis]|nr:hypothetical protein [Bacillus taeanensis]
MKTLWKLAVMVFAVMIASACGAAEDQDMNEEIAPEEEPASGDMNTEEPAVGEEMAPEEPANGGMNTEEPADEEEVAPEEPANGDTGTEDSADEEMAPEESTNE